MKAVEEALALAKENLEHARKEVDLLRRDQKLKAQQENSRSEPRSRRDKPSDLVGIGMRLTEKEAEAQEAEQRVTDLEHRLEDLRRIPYNESDAEADSGDSESLSPKTELSEKDEAYWRKQFAAIDTRLERRKPNSKETSMNKYPNLEFFVYSSDCATLANRPSLSASPQYPRPVNSERCLSP